MLLDLPLDQETAEKDLELSPENYSSSLKSVIVGFSSVSTLVRLAVIAHAHV